MRPRLLNALTALLGDRLSVAGTDRLAYGRDLWPLTTLRLRDGQLPAPPDAILWPETEAEVQAIVRLAVEFGIPLVPFGGGSGVLGGAAPLRGGWVVDLKRMDRIVALDRESGILEVEPGILGQPLEDALNSRGFTLGHFPSSIMLATMGGYLATRSAGQLSSRYGKIEDMVLSFRMVTGTGEVLDTASHRGPPDWNQLVLGTEGTLGIFTLCRVRVWPLTPGARYRGIRFPQVDAGLEAMRKMMQAGLRPSVLRLYDEIDTLMALKGEHPTPEGEEAVTAPPASAAGVSWPGIDAKPPRGRLGDVEEGGAGALGELIRRLGVGGGAIRAALGRPQLLERLSDVLPEGALLILGIEGEPEEVEASMQLALALSAQCGGQDLGSKPGEKWLAKRYSVSYKLSRVFQMGAFADTIEVAATWDKIPRLYQAVREAVSPHAAIMAHFSHAYPEGTSIYFSLAGAAGDPKAAEATYHRVWDAALTAVLAAGGTVSHHHGVGAHKAAWATQEKGAWLLAWERMKATLDPAGILNPGKLVTERRLHPATVPPAQPPRAGR